MNIIRGRRKLKDEDIHIKTSRELKEAALALAEEEGRSLSNWLEKVIRQEIEKASQK
jgi:predicted HicB family RNase H-like nuclease